MPVAKEQIRQIISENNITSGADVYSLLRDSFKDILQELMEAEMDATQMCIRDSPPTAFSRIVGIDGFLPQNGCQFL